MAALVACLALAVPAAARAVIGLERVPDASTTFENPLYVAQPPTDSTRLFIVEKPGTIRVIKDGVLLEPDFLDIESSVRSSGNEEGLFSVAFPPNYGDGSGATTRRFYVYFTNNSGDLRIKEYKRDRTNADLAEVGYSRTVLAIPHPGNANHNGGQLQFGPEGFLYAATGDGGGGGDPPNNAQNKKKLLGKMLRIKPTPSGGKAYSVPPGNPYAGSIPGRGEIWARGLRNPFRFSWDGERLTIGDVGQGTFEEVDILSKQRSKGANFGWSGYEGPDVFNAARVPTKHEPPDFWYCHSSGQDPLCPDEPEGNVITGGYMVRDPALPTLLGRYLYADFTAGQLRSFDRKMPFETDAPVGPSASSLASFGTDNTDRIYITRLNGQVSRLVETP